MRLRLGLCAISMEPEAATKSPHNRTATTLLPRNVHSVFSTSLWSPSFLPSFLFTILGLFRMDMCNYYNIITAQAQATHLI